MKKNTLAHIDLNDIDTQYWRRKDPAWMAAREAQWLRLEKVLQDDKSTKALNIIKRYFLRGTVPKWDKLLDWDDPDRHLDLFLFLCLHPSDDPDVLWPLRQAYLHSDRVRYDDVSNGISRFKRLSTCDYSPGCTDGEQPPLPCCDGRNELFFDLLLGDGTETEIEIQGYSSFYGRKDLYIFPRGEVSALFSMGRWLSFDKPEQLNTDFLYQYERPFAWWLKGSLEDKSFQRDVLPKLHPRPFIQEPGRELKPWELKKAQRQFNKQQETERVRTASSWYWALWNIQQFDEARAVTAGQCRLAASLRKLFDEGEFYAELQLIWRQLKSGAVRVIEDGGWAHIQRREADGLWHKVHRAASLQDIAESSSGDSD